MHRKLTARLGVLAVTGLIALSGCASSGTSTSSSAKSSNPSGTSSAPPSPTGSSGPTAGMITIANFQFQTPTSVKAGSKVSVVNNDSAAHTVTSDNGAAFDVTVQPGKTASFTAPSKPGSYPFHCSFHTMMHGTLKVS